MANWGARGEASPTSRLTDAQVAEIKWHLEQGTRQQRDIARMYGVAQSTVSKIKSQMAWAHVRARKPGLETTHAE